MEERSDILVSVDFGTTYTGVAWMVAGPGKPVQVINNWPGSGDRNERKVPTCIIYNGDGSLSSWGSMCAEDDETLPGKVRREFFKILIEEDSFHDAQLQGLPGAPPSATEAQRSSVDYLEQVYKHVKETIEVQTSTARTGGWGKLAVKFLFSVPTTWKNMQIINIFKRIIRDAGFGVEGPKHSAQVDLTEAEAAAVETLKHGTVNFGRESLFLTVDAGGGTTDLALMRVISADAAHPQMSQMAAVEGVGIGSTHIDTAFKNLITEKLAEYPEVQDQLPVDFTTRMARSHHFKNKKHKFGERAWMLDVFKIEMEGVAHNFSHKGLRVEHGRMSFDQAEMEALFEPQIRGIMQKINEQLDWLGKNVPGEQVDYLILSGGLGSSAYIRERLQQQLTTYPHPSASRVSVICCADPQLVVVRGLLEDEKQRLETGNQLSVLATRIARASYGVIVKELYSPEVHFDDDVRKDPFDSKKKWAMNQIEWLIRKGDPISPNRPLMKQFEMSMGIKDTTRSWRAEIVISHNDIAFLPRSLKQAGVVKLCDVYSNLGGLQQQDLVLKKKRGSFFWGGHKFYICKFDVRVIVAPADLRFELWFAGQRFSGNHEPIAVTWDEAGSRV